MSETLQLEERVEAQDAPKLLVEWSSRWHEFIGSIGPAFARSERRLAGEAPFGLIPLRIMVPSYLLEGLLIFAIIVIQVKVSQLRPFVTPRLASHDVIYYSGDELPRTEDLGGAESGTTGRAGGEESHHRTQTIKIARGGSLVPKIVDAPNLKLPASHDAVANLLAIKPNPGPPPTEGMRSTRAAPSLATTLIAPAPNVLRDYTRNEIRLNSVIAPAPSAARDRSIAAATLNPALIPPAPTVANDASRDHPLIAPLLVPAVIAPAPNISRGRTRDGQSLTPSVVAPAPSVVRDRARSTSALASNVIPPAPGGVNRETSSTPVQMTDTTVIPPPVSAPERASARNSRLNLPAATVIAPPPSADISQDTHRLAGGSIPDPTKAVVPPPPTQSGGGSFMSSLIGRIFGPTEVVPPPPDVHSPDAHSNSGRTGTSLSANVVPPPPSANASAGNSRSARNSAGTSLGTNVVAPPPSVSASGNASGRSLAVNPAPSVVPPPPSVSGSAGATGSTLLASNVVPPPPSVGGGSAVSGSGMGRRGAGLGAPLDAGPAPVPPNTGGSGPNAGVLLSSQPGPKLALPATAATGSLAMSPAGGDKPGLGGAGGGTSIGHGDGSGSGLTGTGPGAGKSDAGHGSDPSARGGISPAAGPGGAGNVPSGTPAVRGVDISGGSSQVTLPSFGDSPAANLPQIPGRTPAKHTQSFDVTVVATATSGGAFEPYKNLLRGEKYTTYLDTSLGTVVMEFADESAIGHADALSAPAPIRTDLASGLPRARMVVACTLDASGNLRNVRVLEAGPANMTAKIVAALRNWKFQPAMRGTQPVDVTAILGFGINTNDRF